MPDLVEQMYCSQQINIPPNLPYILKQYAKAAIRTQPYDLLFWSAAYFRAKAENLPPPVKERIEYPPVDTPSGLSPGFLKVLHKQLGGNTIVKRKDLYQKWLGVCLQKEALNNMLKLGRFDKDITWLNFLAIAAGYLCPMLSRTMILICEILTEEPEGGSAMIPVETFNSLYTYLARLNCGHISSTQAPSESSDLKSVTSVEKLSDQKRSLTGIKGDMARKESGFDSHDGLMVWPDIEPSEAESIPEEEPSLKLKDAVGATSEDGLIVVDDITKHADATHMIVKTPFTEDEKSEDLHRTEVIERDETGGVESPEGVRVGSDVDITEDKETPPATDVTVGLDKKAVDALENPFQEAIQLVFIENEEESKLIQDEEKENTDFWTADESVPPEEIPLEATERVESPATEAEETKSGAHDTIEEKRESITDEGNGGVEEVKITEEADATDNNIVNEMQDSDVLGGKESTNSVHSLEENKEFVPPFHSTHSEDVQDLQAELSEMEDSKDRDSNAEIYGNGDSKSASSEYQAKMDFEKEISSLPSTKYLGIFTATGEKMDRKEISTEKKGEEVKSVESSESKSFTILEEDQYWEDVPGIGSVVPENQITAVIMYMNHWASKQEGMVMPRNIKHFLCPNLDPPDMIQSDDANV